MLKKIAIRSARKSAHLSAKMLHKALNFTGKVENKATRILNGTDYSIKTNEMVPFEKIYYNTLPYITPINPAMPAIGSKGSIVLLAPSLDGKSFYGGTATALLVAGRLAILEGKSLKIVQTLATGKAQNLPDFFKKEGLNISEDRLSVISVADRSYNVYGYLSMHPEDTYIASAWWDAYLIGQLPLSKKFIYLIQDYEPIFYNNSDLYVLAESTYKLNNYIPLCNTRLMYDFMKERGYEAFNSHAASWFEPAVSRLQSGMVLEKKSTEKKKIFVYGRPDVHRNLLFSALNSLDFAFKAGFLSTHEWEVCMAGQDNVPDIKLSCGVTVVNHGKLSMEKYINFSKSIDIAISLMMAPHPNYPTLEFASIGTSVVTTKYANKQDLSMYSKNIIMSDIDVESLAGAIKLAATAGYDERIRNLDTNHIEHDWSEALDVSLKKVFAKL